MAFLPIVERELRVAARKRSTFWVRIIAALVALIIGSGFLVVVMVGPGFGAATLGRGLFGTLTWLSLGVALSAGLFFTSDCLSEEKREGTMGFLFLTDLKGYDVVLGKLLATSLRGCFALLAVFPILAITLLMGGVTGAEFWQTSLALVNALFISLTAGLFISAISRDSQKALAATLLLLVLWVAGGPAIDAAFAMVKQGTFRPVMSLSSPGYLFASAGAWGVSPFWRALLVNQVLAWTLLGLTCALLPRAWQEKAAKPLRASGAWANWWKFGGIKRRAALRRELDGANPIVWLVCRERRQTLALWAVSILSAAGFCAIFASDHRLILWHLWNFLEGALAIVLYLVAASQACRFFTNARTMGLFELLFSTPLTVRQIVQGQWRAWLRMFGAPLALFLATQLVGEFLVQEQTWNMNMARPTTAAPPAPVATPSTTNTTVVATTNVTVSFTATMAGFHRPSGFLTLALSLSGTLIVISNLAAVAWFGMWMGLTSKRANLATMKTIVFVQIIPWFVVSFASALVVPLMFFLPQFKKLGSGMTPQLAALFPLAIAGLATVLFLTKDIAFIIWARRKLYSELRERAAGMSRVRVARPPPLPREIPKTRSGALNQEVR
jgi:hypothetical protein